MESNTVQTPQTPKQLFQTHISQLELIYANNNECYSFMTKNISLFISVFENFKVKLHSLYSTCSTSNLPIVKLVNMILQNYHANINNLIDNLKLINQGLDAPFKNYQASFSKLKHLKDLQTKFITIHSKLTKTKHNYFSELKSFQYQCTNMDEQVDELTQIGKTRLMNKIKDYEKEYKANIKEINSKLDAYNNKGNIILQEIQGAEGIFQSSVQVQIKALVNHWIKKTEKDSQIVPQLKSLIDGEDSNIFKRGNENVYKVCAIKHFEFEPYEIEELKKLEGDKSKVKLLEQKVHDFICMCKKEFSDIAKNYDTEIESNKQELMKFCNFVLENKSKGISSESSNINNICIPNKDLAAYYAKISKLLDDKELSWFFLMYLNYQRSKGQFELTDKQLFKFMGMIMKHLIIHANKEKDFSTVRIILILSQTYFALNSKKQKVYLIRYLDNHPLFKDKEFWRFFFENNIIMELENFNKQQYQNDLHREGMKNNMIYSKIMSGCHHMMEFGNNKENVKDIVKEFAERFKLEEEKKNIILTMVDDVKVEEKPELDGSLELKIKDSKGSGRDSSVGNSKEAKTKEKIEEVKEEEKNVLVQENYNNIEGKGSEIIKEQNGNNEAKVQEENVTDDKKDNTVLEKVSKEEGNIEDKKEEVSNEHGKENMNVENKKEENIIKNEIDKEEPLKEDDKKEINDEKQQEKAIINDEVKENELQNNEVQGKLV